MGRPDDRQTNDTYLSDASYKTPGPPYDVTAPNLRGHRSYPKSQRCRNGIPKPPRTVIFPPELSMEEDPPAPFHENGAVEFFTPRFGSYVPGVPQLRKMLELFRSLIDYHTYQPHNTAAVMSDKKYKHVRC